MKKLMAECRLSDHELLMINTRDIERIVKERLARELANTILREMEVTETLDCMTMTKVIRAELLLADDKDIRVLREAEKFFEATHKIFLKEDN